MFLLANEFNHVSLLMNVSDLRHRVISHNLANVNTPGYERLDVVFEELLAQKVRGGEASGTPVTPKVVPDAAAKPRGDGNSVDVDSEIGHLNRNALLFQTYSQLLSSQFDLMRRAIR